MLFNLQSAYLQFPIIKGAAAIQGMGRAGPASENNSPTKLNLNDRFSGPFSPNYSRRYNKFLPSLYTMTATTHRVPLDLNIYRRQKPVRLKQRLIVRPLGPFVFQSRRAPLKMRAAGPNLWLFLLNGPVYIIYQRGSIVLYVIPKSYRQRARHVPSRTVIDCSFVILRRSTKKIMNERMSPATVESRSVSSVRFKKKKKTVASIRFRAESASPIGSWLIFGTRIDFHNKTFSSFDCLRPHTAN